MAARNGASFPRRGEAAAVLALAGGATQDAAAEAAGVSRRTVVRWLGDPAFVARVSATRDAAFAAALGRLSEAAVRAADTLQELLADKNAAIRLGAASAILRAAPAWRESCDLAARLTAIEAAIADQSDDAAPGRRWAA